MEQFEMYQFRFVDKKTKMHAAIYARTEETAYRIINIWNEFDDHYHWVKARFRFKKKYMTYIPPYELEQEQEETVLEMKEKYLLRKHSKLV